MYDEDFESEACQMQRNISKYVAEYGSNGGNMIKSTFGGQDLPPPILNISAPSLEKDSSRLDSYYYVDLAFKVVTDDPSLLLWTYANEIYHLNYMQENGICQAKLDYKWGFSYIQLYIMVILHILWSLGLYTMWVRAYMVMKKRGRGKEEVAGEHKAVFELAAAMREQMDEPAKEEAVDLSALTEAKLRRRITKDLRGGSISYTTPLLPNGESGEEWKIKVWLESHKLSIIAMVACVAAMMFNAFVLLPRTMVLLPLPGEFALALYIGSTRGSRIVLFVWIFLLVTIPSEIATSISSAY
ncbi:hypothetical protein G6011_02607 [Alternaria panax]|uniref:Uncharacterized protein n=1 Tax=Alternaria panax TaxID=48097 RepID=A0AAD4FAI5_9PLEO|nr:hypothetical protein G6011_02607 [Alternaria panax]